MQQTVLLVGGSGRTGRRVLAQLVGRGTHVRAIVRSAQELPAGIAQDGQDGQVAVVEASLLSLADDEFMRHLRGCDAVVSCLGHVISLEGVLGPPRDLVTRATTKLCRAPQSLRPARPVKFILMSSVSVHRPRGLDTRRGARPRRRHAPAGPGLQDRRGVAAAGPGQGRRGARPTAPDPEITP